MKKFLTLNGMNHVLRAHQLCMEGYSVQFDDQLSTVWSAPNYCYRCGNMASILEVSPGGQRFFNVFDAAPENERDGPAQQQQQARVSLESWVHAMHNANTTGDRVLLIDATTRPPPTILPSIVGLMYPLSIGGVGVAGEAVAEWAMV